ncbi:MAG: nucleoside phosphorylase [Roseiflexaceae bacterium]|nr:nucleoside phosphorylase [Roseiflexaceae bacterium]
MSYPILDFDPNREAMIDPSRTIRPLDGMPQRCVICFFHDVIHDLVHQGRARPIAIHRSEISEHPVYILDAGEGREVALFHPGVGAPLAVGLFEETIALGGRIFIACGGAGALDQELALGHIIIPTDAVRDEGTSYHYLAPGQPAQPSSAAVAAIEQVLQEQGVPYRTARTWTTDAFFRETPGKIQLRRSQGCLVVEMEAAAFFAVAQFRGVTFGQLLYSGDDLSGAEWDSRNWNQHTSTRERLLWLAVEAVLRLA